MFDRFRPFGLNGGWVLVDREVHLFHGGRGHQLVTETAGGGPDEQVGGCARLQRLDENLVFAPFDLERRTAGGDLRDGFAEFNHAEMVLRRTQARDSIGHRRLRLKLLAEYGQGRDCDKHQSAFHGLHSFSQCLTSQRSLQGGPVSQTSPKATLLVQPRLQNFGLLPGTKKLELPVPHFRPPGFELHGMNPLSSAVIVDQVTGPRYLHEEGFPLDDLSLAVADLIDEVNVAVFVDVYVPVNQIGNRNGDRTASSALRDHVDEFLRKSVKHDTPGTLAPLACDRVESRQPVVGVLRLPFGPLPHQVDHIAHLLAGAFLIPMQRCLGCVATSECLPPCRRVVHIARVQLRLGIVHFVLVLFALLQDQRDVNPVDRGDLPCLLVHFTIESPVDDQTAKVRQRPDVAEEVVQLFANHVVQPADLVRRAHGQVQRQVSSAFPVLQPQPRSRDYLLADTDNYVLVRHRAMFQSIERRLKFFRQRFRKVRASGSHARRHQVGDDPDSVAFRRHRDLRQVPPGRALLLPFVLLVREGFAVTEAVLNPTWKAMLLHHANNVEVVVASVLRRRLRVQGDGMFQTELPDDDFLDGLLLRHRASLLPQVDYQPRYHIWTSEVFQREQVILGPNGISNFEETPRAETRDGVILRHPVRTAVDPSVVKYQVAVASQGEGRQPEATSRPQLVRPPAQNPL